MTGTPLRLGNIVYSNCYPVHAKLLEEPQPDLVLVDGTPAELNAALAAGTIDVAPCSSIEYARHADRYRVVDGPAIASDGAVDSILFESTVPLKELDGAVIAVPSASATSVVLLRTLLETRLGVRPRYEWFDQAADHDPLEGGARAALRIGDIALRRRPPADRLVTDLGQEWRDWTALPFVYAVWQCRAERAARVWRLRDLLSESRQWFEVRIETLAARRASDYGLDADLLTRYWRGLKYQLDERAQAGLLHFYRLAADLGEAPPTDHLRFLQDPS